MAALSASAQYLNRNITGEQRQEQKRQEIRERINFDYSVPDYNVTGLDEKVMGWRLARILQHLEKSYTQNLYNQMLFRIRNVQMEELEVSYLPIDKIKIHNIQKQDSVITIKINTVSGKKKGKVAFDITLTFVNSLSDDDTTNNLFSDIGRYIRKNESF